MAEIKLTTILIVAGGTGGHVFPGLAVAEVLQKQGKRVLWLGTEQGMENHLIPARGIEFYSIPMLGMRGKGWIRKITTFARLIKTVIQTRKIILKTQTDVVLGMGGYVTAPAGLAAWFLRKKLLIHEQNAIAGLSNRLLAIFATQILQAFPKTFKSNAKVLTVGNPVRASIANLPEPPERLVQHTGKLRVLVLGGSLGAKAINIVIPEVLAALQQDITIKHQTGKVSYPQTLAAYQAKNLTVELVEFIDDMAAAYAWADIVICRSGALTISELAAVGLASILVPLPSAVDDHQTANAKYLTSQGAGILLPQCELKAETVIQLLKNFAADRNSLVSMASKARSLAMTDAAKQVADIC